MAFKIKRAKPTGSTRSFVTRTCCGPDGSGPCQAAAEELPCGIGEVMTFEEPSEVLRERGERFRRLRRERELKLSEVAYILDLSIADVSAIETGHADVEGWPELLEQFVRGAEIMLSRDEETFTITREEMRTLSTWANEMRLFYESGHATPGRPVVVLSEALIGAAAVASKVRDAFVLGNTEPAPALDEQLRTVERKIHVTPVGEAGARVGEVLHTSTVDVFGYVMAPNAELVEDVQIERSTRDGIFATIKIKLPKGTIVEKPTIENLRTRLYFAAVHHLRAAGASGDTMQHVIERIFTHEHFDLGERLDTLRKRLLSIMVEAFGPQPHRTFDEALEELEKQLTRIRANIAERWGDPARDELWNAIDQSIDPRNREPLERGQVRQSISGTTVKLIEKQTQSDLVGWRCVRVKPDGFDDLDSRFVSDGVLETWRVLDPKMLAHKRFEHVLGMATAQLRESRPDVRGEAGEVMDILNHENTRRARELDARTLADFEPQTYQRGRTRDRVVAFFKRFTG
jgi:transcriptional regulator with XRE-family HTH domain